MIKMHPSYNLTRLSFIDLLVVCTLRHSTHLKFTVDYGLFKSKQLRLTHRVVFYVLPFVRVHS